MTERFIDCDHCGACVRVGWGQPDGLSDAEAERWWDDHHEHWCPVFGEFRQTITRSEIPCEA